MQKPRREGAGGAPQRVTSERDTLETQEPKCGPQKEGTCGFTASGSVEDGLGPVWTVPTVSLLWQVGGHVPDPPGLPSLGAARAHTHVALSCGHTHSCDERRNCRQGS